MADAKKTAPTHPHPKAPDTPPGNIVVGAASGVVDRVTDTVSGLAQGGVSVAQDLVARFTGGAKPRIAPTGSPTARKTAAKVRSSVDDATDKAERTGRATVSSAKSGAKRTASTARSSARKTAATAKRAAS